MLIAEKFLAELNGEAANTRKLLERVPAESFGWKPHEKSMSLMELARHVAEIPSWVRYTLDYPGLDFAEFKYEPPQIATNAELLAFFDANVADAQTVLGKTPDEVFRETWTMRQGEAVFFTLPKSVCLRTWAFSHWYHHRGQLTVYLRLLDVPLPGMYGPTADER